MSTLVCVVSSRYISTFPAYSCASRNSTFCSVTRTNSGWYGVEPMSDPPGPPQDFNTFTTSPTLMVILQT